MAPAQPGTDLAGCQRKPVWMGKVSVIIDPLAPAWMREVIDDTTTKVSEYYEHAFQPRAKTAASSIWNQ